MSYNEELQSNNAELEKILQAVNELPNGAGNAVRYVPQELTEEQKTQARENIGAASEAELDSVLGKETIMELERNRSNVNDDIASATPNGTFSISAVGQMDENVDFLTITQNGSSIVLRSTGTIHDEINENTITRKIFSYMIDGSQNIQKSSVSIDGGVRLFINPTDIKKQPVCRSGDVVNLIGGGAVSKFGAHDSDLPTHGTLNTFRIYSTGGSGEPVWPGTAIQWVMDNSKTGLNANSTIQEYKDYLSANPIIVYYAVIEEDYENETIEPFALDNLSPNLSLNMDSNLTVHYSGLSSGGRLDDIERSIVDLNGRMKELEDGIMSCDYDLIKFNVIPQIDNISYAETITLYDSLLSDNDGYVSKRTLGTDDFGNKLYEYSFGYGDLCLGGSSVVYEEGKKPVVGITGGTHGNEKPTTIGLYYFLKSLVFDESFLLNRIKNNLTLKVIPVVNPSGWNLSTRNNGNDVNINRNFTTNWNANEPYSGSSSASEKETQIVEQWMSESGLDFYFDYHTADMGTQPINQNCSWLQVPDTMETADSLLTLFCRNIRKLTNKYHKTYAEISVEPMGNVTKNNALAQSHNHAATIIPNACLLETTTYLYQFKETDGIYYHGLEWCADLVANFIVEIYYYLSHSRI